LIYSYSGREIYYLLIKFYLIFTNIFGNNLQIIFTNVFVKCNAVYRALCDLEWYKLESRKARNFIMLMIRTYQPFHITAGKIVPLTMATFCSVSLFSIFTF